MIRSRTWAEHNGKAFLGFCQYKGIVIGHLGDPKGKGERSFLVLDELVADLNKYIAYIGNVMLQQSACDR